MAETTIVSGSAWKTGMPSSNQTFYAVNSGRWWTFQVGVTSNTITTSYYWNGSSWVASTSLTDATWAPGSNNDWCAAYLNIASTDVVYLVAYSGYVIRAVISGTAVSYGTRVQFAAINTGTEPNGVAAAFDSSNKLWIVYDDSGDSYYTVSSTAETGSSGITGYSGTYSAWPSYSNYVHSHVLLPISTGMLLLSDDSQSPPTGVNYNYITAPGNVTPSEVFATAVTMQPEDWAACKVSDSDVHCVRITGSNTFEHRRWNGTSWNAGQTIPTQAVLAGANINLVSDGTNVWLICLSSAAGNPVVYVEWSGGAWGSWQTLESTSATRDGVVSSPQVASNAIQVVWTEGSASPFSVAGEQLLLSNGPTTVTVADSAAGAQSVTLATVTLSLADSAAGAESSLVIGLPLPDAGTGTEHLTLAPVAIALGDTASGSTTPSIAVSAPVSDSAAGSASVGLATISVPLGDAAAGSDAITVTATMSVVDRATSSDAVSLNLITFTVADAATGHEVQTITVTLAPRDTAAGSEGVSVQQSGVTTVSVSDSASEQTVVALGPITPGVSDSATGMQALAVFVPLVLNDTASGMDVIAPLVRTTVADSATGTDQPSITASVPLSPDAATGTQGVVLATVNIPLSDRAASAEALTVQIEPAAGDAASGTEQVSLAPVAIALVESATGATLQAVTVTPSVPADVASGTDLVSVIQLSVVLVPVSDTATGAEAVVYTPVTYVAVTFVALDGSATFTCVDGRATFAALDGSAVFYALD